MVFSVVVISVPRSALLRSVDVAERFAGGLLRTGESAVERVGDVAKDVGRGVAATTQSAAAQGRVLFRARPGRRRRYAGDRQRAHSPPRHRRAGECAVLPGGRGAVAGVASGAERGLRERIGGRAVACEETDVDRYGRIVAVCRAGGEDLKRLGWSSVASRLPTGAYSRGLRGRGGSREARGSRTVARATSWRPGTGARGSAWRGTRRKGSRTPAAVAVAAATAASRGTSRAQASVSTTCPAPSTTSARASVPRRASAGSAARRKPARPAGAGRRGKRLQGRPWVLARAVAVLWGGDPVAPRAAGRHGNAPVPRVHLAYQFIRDGDGVVCE